MILLDRVSYMASNISAFYKNFRKFMPENTLINKIERVIKKIIRNLPFIYYKSKAVDNRRFWMQRIVSEKDNHLQLYWDDEKNLNRKKLVELVVDAVKHLDPVQQISIFEYGSHVGINIRLIKAQIPTGLNVKFFAVEPNKEAFNFMQEHLPFVKSLNGEDEVFSKAKDFPGQKIQISIVMVVFYSMEGKRVVKVLKKLAEISQYIIICDCLAYFNKKKAKFIEIFDKENTKQGLFAHPFKKILGNLGFNEIKIYKVPILHPASTGFLVAKKLTK